MKTHVPTVVRAAILFLVMVAVLGMMLICSAWNFASSDPNHTQNGWIAVADMVGFPAKVFPWPLSGGLQFLMVFGFWVVIGYFVSILPFRFAYENPRQPGTPNRGDFLAEELSGDVPQDREDSKAFSSKP
jgi:hypothetical protein